ncbi:MULTISPECIES: conjugal transfer protein [unclassified Curtobacterium]|uniref:conjugal transfer protein n=1 Tax=unclassified Curtobacterium TaxID=257496 RepID=UPI003806DEDA
MAVARDVIGLGSRGGRRGWTRTIQVLIAAATIVTIVVGVRSMFLPTAAVSAPASATFPQAIAASTAEQFAETYFTWDQDDPAPRAAAIATLVVAGLSDQVGWDGEGRSSAGTARAAGFSYVDAANAIVTVVVPVTSYVDGKPGTPETMSLAVPVTVIGARVWVSALPASVGVPTSAPTVPTPSAPTPDQAATAASRSAVAQYFSALDAGDVPLSDQGNRSTGLDGALTFRALTGWQVDRSGGDRKTGWATVRWQTAGGATIEQQYRLVVTDDSGWRVRSATAAVRSA